MLVLRSILDDIVSVWDTEMNKNIIMNISDLDETYVFGYCKPSYGRAVLCEVSDDFWKSLDYFENVRVYRTPYFEINGKEMVHKTLMLEFNRMTLFHKPDTNKIFVEGMLFELVDNAFIVFSRNSTLSNESVDLLRFTYNVLDCFQDLWGMDSISIFHKGYSSFEVTSIELPKKLKLFISKIAVLRR